MTMTTEISENGAITLSRMNLSGYLGQVNIFTVVICLLLHVSVGTKAEAKAHNTYITLCRFCVTDRAGVQPINRG